jgi:hypothetical protein
LDEYWEKINFGTKSDPYRYQLDVESIDPDEYGPVPDYIRLIKFFKMRIDKFTEEIKNYLDLQNTDNFIDFKVTQVKLLASKSGAPEQQYHFDDPLFHEDDKDGSCIYDNSLIIERSYSIIIPLGFTGNTSIENTGLEFFYNGQFKTVNYSNNTAVFFRGSTCHRGLEFPSVKGGDAYHYRLFIAIGNNTFKNDGKEVGFPYPQAAFNIKSSSSSGKRAKRGQKG